MKIKTIKIKNIGPYIGENKISFDISDKSKRMVLIGGKNGAGKTTLFNAIKICLYGCVAYGYEANNAKYYEEIEKIINEACKQKNIYNIKQIKKGLNYELRRIIRPKCHKSRFQQFRRRLDEIGRKDSLL